MNKEQFCNHINHYIKNNISFLFLIDYEKKKPIVLPIAECKQQGIAFQFNQQTTNANKNINIKANPIDFDTYQKAFNKIKEGILHGDSFLTNLTFPTLIDSNADLHQIYQSSVAPYKLYVKDRFVCFSPESFIKIENNVISTFPMKGTIMANVPHAEEKLLDNKKETWEHNTIVDLMRNDLSMIANNVEVKRFRFISEINTLKGKMLQTSSEICGQLHPNWQKDFGHLLLKLLPAGSISGAPKEKTIRLIDNAEIDKRGYYTGIFGTYNNGKVDSAVIIRYIEKDKNGKFTYRSGGGITFMSDAKEEYQEVIDKVYIPTK